MDNTDALNLFNKLIGVLNDTGYSEYVGVKLKQFNDELTIALNHIAKDETVWPEPDWAEVAGHAYRRNPNDPSIPPEHLAEWFKRNEEKARQILGGNGRL